MSAHSCPSRCHKCPDMDGAVMPGCYGSAVRANYATDLSRCTCQRPARDDRITALEKEVKKLKTIVLEIQAKGER